MRLLKGVFVVATIVPLITGLSGCTSSFIQVRKGTDRVSLADANQVGSCQSRREITLRVLAKVGFITRSPEDVEANLFQLARNDAVDAGADTVVKGESKELGTRTFEIYKCRP